MRFLKYNVTILTNLNNSCVKINVQCTCSFFPHCFLNNQKYGKITDKEFI